MNPGDLRGRPPVSGAPAERITSRANPLIGHVRKLQASASYRRETGRFCCEGWKMLDEALSRGVPVELVLRAESAPLPQALPVGVRHVELPDRLFQAVADTKSPQGVLFICPIPQTALPQRLEKGNYLVLDGVQDPGNAGTLWRTADAFGAGGLFFLPGCADPYGPKTVRSTMGAVFRLPAWQTRPEDLRDLLERSEIPLYAAALHTGGMDIRRRPPGPMAVVIGSEGSGVSRQMLSMSQGFFYIPMTERCESLNAAVAGSIILWELFR